MLINIEYWASILINIDHAISYWLYRSYYFSYWSILSGTSTSNHLNQNWPQLTRILQVASMPSTFGPFKRATSWRSSLGTPPSCRPCTSRPPQTIRGSWWVVAGMAPWSLAMEMMVVGMFEQRRTWKHTHTLYNYIIETLSYIIIHELPDATRLVNHKVKGAGSTVVFFRCSIWWYLGGAFESSIVGGDGACLGCKPSRYPIVILSTRKEWKKKLMAIMIAIRIDVIILKQ